MFLDFVDLLVKLYQKLFFFFCIKHKFPVSNKCKCWILWAISWRLRATTGQLTILSAFWCIFSYFHILLYSWARSLYLHAQKVMDENAALKNYSGLSVQHSRRHQRCKTHLIWTEWRLAERESFLHFTALECLTGGTWRVDPKGCSSEPSSFSCARRKCDKVCPHTPQLPLQW